MIREALEEQKKERLRPVIVDKCERVVFALYEEAHVGADGNVYKVVFDVMEQAAVKAFFSGGADKQLGDKMYKLAASQKFTQSLIAHLIKSSTFTVPITNFVNQRAEKAAASKAKLYK